MSAENATPVEPAKDKVREASGFWGRHLLTPAAIIVAGVMISGTILWSNKQFLDVARLAYSASPPAGESPTAAPPPQPPAPASDIAKVNLEGEPFIGDPNAPVVMAYWFDYQCPYCKQEEENVLPQLIKDYVDAGKVRIVFKDFQFLGPDSQIAGLAARAVWEVAPDKFREWHKAMFDHQDDENAGWGNKDDIVALTKTIPGIDIAKIEELMTSRAADYNKAMEADATEGNIQGVGGTPSFLIGKQMIVGAQPYQSLKAAIDGVLRAM
ncbi:MAG: thioredoxin domain-containing protein [Rhizobiales bacterium]|nr:thioredoxin domain-containing protein [Hyphomicrobiales bacterium]MBN9009224.1 thioredoxin domain-containing protein [Hyphomicrobiales bacterium]